MADKEVREDHSYALFREYMTKPHYRRACVISFAPDTDDGYMLSQIDPLVCDTGFMATVHKSMTAERTPETSVEKKTKAGITMYRVQGDPLKPGHPDHFSLAVETIPRTVATEPERMA